MDQWYWRLGATSWWILSWMEATQARNSLCSELTYRLRLKLLIRQAQIILKYVLMTLIILIQIINSVTHIIHHGTVFFQYLLTPLIAWHVNLNLGLSSFEFNIRELCQLMDLALISQARLV